MGTPTLFGDSDELKAPPKPRTPAPKWLVDELVDRWGVSRETAEGWTMRQAYAVREKKLAEATDGWEDGDGTPERHLLGHPQWPERRAAAALLEETAEEFRTGHCTADEFYRVLRGSLYVLTTTELVRVAKGLIPVMRGSETSGRATG